MMKSVQYKKSQADYIIVLNQASFDKYESWVRKGGVIIVNSSLANISKNVMISNMYLLQSLKWRMKNSEILKMSNILALGILSKIRRLY